MANYDEVKAWLDSDAQTLDRLAQAGEGLKALFSEGEWDESVIGVIHNYPNGLHDWRDRLSRVRAEVEKRGLPPEKSPLEKLEDTLIRLAADQEEVSRSLAATHEEIAKNLATLHEHTMRAMSTQASAIQETLKGFREFTAPSQETAPSAKSEEYLDPLPEQPSAPPAEQPADDPPENSSFWKN
ncbi:hypothetical protein OUY22_02865 [Nonomuraea sp. MCN248]|uniref:Uncharacterized protein n=1 Tax=Nonomuraea corallina TaxID=2989783 RepID=A0ABT4S575_9ACTN|nr:hypothetical protein [Nonomuraea corallina]MDA0632342.1 hypothetical protein [Nonomuraea corallina]